MQRKAMHHTTGINPILSEVVFERESRGGGAIANKEEEPYTAMATRRYSSGVFLENAE